MWAFSVKLPAPHLKKKSRAAECLGLHVSVCINCQLEVCQGAIKSDWGLLVSPSPSPFPSPP